MAGFFLELKFPDTDRNLEDIEINHFEKLKGNESLIKKLVVNINTVKLNKFLYHTFTKLQKR